MAKTIAQLRTEAQTIKNATIIGENTATRVGGAIEDVVDYVYDASVIQGNTTRIIDLNDYTQNSKFINGSNAWAQQNVGGVYATSINIPVNGGDIMKMKANAQWQAIYAFLRSNTPLGSPVDFSQQITGRQTLATGAEVEVTIPNDCTLLYVFVHTKDNDDFFPDSITITTLGADIMVSEAVTRINEELFGGGEKLLDLHQFETKQNFINGSNVWNSNFSTYQIGHYVHVLLGVIAGTNFSIKTSSNQCIYAFLTGVEIFGTPSFVSGYNQRYTIPANTETQITIPSGCNYLYIYKGTPDDDFLPQLTQLNNTTGMLDENNPVKNNMYHRGVLMGDSLSAGVDSYFYNGNRYNDVFTYEQISDHLSALTGCPFDNVAKRGTGYVADTRNINNAWEQAQATDFSVYDVVVMFYGVNDYIQNSPIGDPDVEAVDTVAGNMQRVFDKIMTDNPNCKILVVGPANTWGQVSVGGDYTSNVTYGDASTDYALGSAIGGLTLRDYLNMQKTMCEKYHVQFYCMADGGLINFFNIKNALADGLHPTVEMRKYIAQEIAKNLI